MDYHLLTCKIKITASERGEPPGKKKCLFQMIDIRPCVGTLWHGLTSEYKRKKHRSDRFHWNLVPIESVSLRLYSDAYPCHRVPTHGLISVI